MPSAIHTRVCYDGEYIASIECPSRSSHAKSIASLGSVGIVPCSGFVHACGCVANGLERQMIREFRVGLGPGNRFFLEEIKARLARYMFSEHVAAGVCLFIPGYGLVVYYNWVYSQQPVVGSLRDGTFFAPSNGREVESKFPPWKADCVFPLPFGELGTATTVGGLMGSTRVLSHASNDAGYSLVGRSVKGKVVRHVCDVTPYVLHGDYPILGDCWPCGCRATQGSIDGLRRYFSIRESEVREGAILDLDLTSFARVLRRTGAVLHWQPGMGVLCLFSAEVVALDLDILFARDSLIVEGWERDAVSGPPHRSGTLDSRIQKSYVSALPTCRYLQYH